MASSSKDEQGNSFNIEARIAQVEAATQDKNFQPSLTAKIQRVPKHFREREELHQYSALPGIQQHKVAIKYFTPKMLSIGPIHHHLRLGEQYKRRWTAKYVEETNMSTRELYQNIRDRIQNLKKLFAEDVLTLYRDDDYLAWMLFIDGCSVLHFMKYYKFEEPKSLEIKYDQMVYMWRDLILLENQLPYQVLLLLSVCGHQLLNTMKSYLFKSLQRSMIDHQKRNPDYDHQQETGHHHVMDFQGRPTHLLHFLRQIITDHIIGRNRQENDDNEAVNNLRTTDYKRMPGKLVRNLRPTYKNIRDLKAAGIGVKKAKVRRDIYYSPGKIFGHLVIPEFTVNDSTAITILNVIAYEMCPDFENGYEVSSFVEFLESVIDDAEDVKELRKAGIIVNMLGSDEEVAQLFNRFSSDLVVPYKYESVRRQIEFQYTLALRTWSAQFLSDHFSSPWTIAAFIAAILALLFSGMQAFLTLFPKK